MLAVPVKSDDGGSCTAAVAAPTPGRDPVLRATPRLREVQLLHRVPPGPPGPPPRTHLEAMVNHPVTVEVHANGQVFVGGSLVAEVTAPDGRVVSRDELVRELSAHRCAEVIAQRLTELIRYTENSCFDDKDRRDFGAALFAGLADDPGELTGRQAYRDGHRAGTTLRALRAHIVAALPDDPNWQTIAEAHGA